MFILINWTYLSNPGKMYAYLGKLSQTVSYINLLSAKSNSVGKALGTHIMGLSYLKVNYLEKKGRFKLKTVSKPPR